MREFKVALAPVKIETWDIAGNKKTILAAGGHKLAFGGAMRIGSDGRILNEIPYGESGVRIISIPR